jgi:amino acid transporter
MKNRKRNWILQGLAFGAVIFLGLYILYPLIVGNDMRSQNLFAGIVACTLSGLVYGYIEKWIYAYFDKNDK